MATQARGSSERAKHQAMAERMKRLKIVRRTARCPICYRVVGIPLDRHFFGGCK